MGNIGWRSGQIVGCSGQIDGVVGKFVGVIFVLKGGQINKRSG